MNNPLHILVTGRHPDIVPTVVRLLDQTPDWMPVGTITNDQAMQYMDAQKVDVLLLSSGLCSSDELQLKQHLNKTHPAAVVIQHYGGGSGLLNAEIFEALNKRL